MARLAENIVHEDPRAEAFTFCPLNVGGARQRSLGK